MKIFKISAIIIGVLIALLIIAALVLPKFIDVNQHRAFIEEKASQATGRQVTITEDISLSILPKLSIKTGKVSVSNPKDFIASSITAENNTFFTLDSATIGIELLPLLKKQIKFNTIMLDGITVNLIKNKQQLSNWEFGATSAAQAETQSTNADTVIVEDMSAETEINAYIDNLLINRIRFANTQIRYIDEFANASTHVSDINITIDNFAFRQDSPIDLSLLIKNEDESKDISVKLQTLLNFDLQNKLAQLKTVNADITSNGVALNNTIDNVDIDINSLNTTVSQLRAELSQDKAKALLTAASINFDGDDLVNINGIELNAEQQENNLSLSTSQIVLPLSTRLLRIDSVDINAINLIDKSQQDNNAASNSLHITLPSQTIALANDNLSMADIKGNIKYHNLEQPTPFSIAKLSFTQSSQAFSVQGFKARAESLLALESDIEGTLSPLQISTSTSLSSADLSQLLVSLGQNALDISTNDANLKIQASYKSENNSIMLKSIKGNIAETTIAGNAEIKLGSAEQGNPAYLAQLQLGKIYIDKWLQSNEDNSSGEISEANDESSAVTSNDKEASKQTLEQLISAATVHANLSIAEIVSSAQETTIQNLNVSANSNEGNNKIDLALTGNVKQSSSPDNYNVLIESMALFSKDITELHATNLALSNAKNHLKVSLPLAKIDTKNPIISLDNIEASVKQMQNTFDLNIGNVSFDKNNNNVTLKSVQGNGSYEQQKIIANLPFSQVDLNSNHLVSRDLTIDINASEPVGRFSSPSIDVNLNNMSLGKTAITFEGKDGKVELALNPSTNNDISGTLKASRLNLKGLLSRFDAYPFDVKSSALTNINVNTPIKFTNNVLRINDFSATIDKSKIAGSLVANMSATPSYEINLDIDKVDIRDYIESQEKDATNQNNNNSKDTDIPYQAIKGLNLNAKINILELTSITGSLFKNTNIGITSKANKLTVSPLTTQYAGGTIDVKGSIDANNNSLSVDANLDKLNVGETLSSLGITDKFNGKGSFVISARGVGKTTNSLINTLKGKASIDLKDGDLRGIDLQQILLSGFKAFNTLSNRNTDIKYEPSQNTKFGSLSGNWVINNGIMSGNDLLLTAPAFKVTGNGNINLPSKTINYAMNIGVVKSFEGQGRVGENLQGRNIPLRISGNLESPSFRLDLSKLLQNELLNNSRLGEEADKIQNKLLNKLNIPGLDNSILGGSSNNSNADNNQNQQQKDAQDNNNDQKAEQSLEDQLREKATKELSEQLLKLF